MRLITLLLLSLLWLTVGCSQQDTEISTAEPTAAPIKTAVPTNTAAPTAVAPTETAAPTVPPSQPSETATATPAPATATATSAPTATAVPTEEPVVEMPDGALVGMTLDGNVGILLDGLSADVRDQIVEDWLDAPPEEWEARALRQVRFARLRLNFRDFHTSRPGQLPMPPQEVWEFDLDTAGPSRQTIDGHDLIMHAYTYRSTLLTSAESVAEAEPELAEVGGRWEEPFIFPADPDHLLQRTGNSCLNEGGFPPNSYDAINAWHFYDYTCTADNSGIYGGCHATTLPALSCRQAVSGRIGEVAATMQFERLEWDDELADSVRTGDISSTVGPDLVTLTEDMNHNRIIYRFFNYDDCAYTEGATSGLGWRRLLLFDATVHNTSTEPLHIGWANAEDDDNHIFTFAPCHAHFHYSNYGDFTIADQESLLSGKQAFCVQSTNRVSNNETSPLTHEYTCAFQGIQAGWVDEYIAGLDAQWVDITDISLPEDGGEIVLGFASNRDQFICEGTLITDENGEQLYEPSGQLTDFGASINRPQCDFIDDWNVNNESELALFVPPAGSYVTEPCDDSLIGPLRNCGFTQVALDDSITSCAIGETVTLPLDSAAIEIEGELIARVCERSDLLGDLACELTQSVTNLMVASTAESITFTCPAVRDAQPQVGGFSLIVAPLYEGDSAE